MLFSPKPAIAFVLFKQIEQVEVKQTIVFSVTFLEMYLMALLLW